MDLKKAMATAVFAAAMMSVTVGAAEATPAATPPAGGQPIQAGALAAAPAFVGLTPQQRAYCQNAGLTGLAGLAVGAVAGFFAGSGIGFAPGAIIGGLIGGAAGSSAPMPGPASDAGLPPGLRCMSGGMY